jgi:anti-anti-sigma regulatory factor
VTRIGTQVVVRLSGDVGDASRERLRAAFDEIAEVALHRVVIDLDEVDSLQDAGMEFVTELDARWSVRFLNTPPGLRGTLPRQERTAKWSCP